MKIKNKLDIELKNEIWNNVKQITIDGGFEKYNLLMNMVDRGEIDTMESLHEYITSKNKHLESSTMLTKKKTS